MVEMTLKFVLKSGDVGILSSEILWRKVMINYSTRNRNITIVGLKYKNHMKINKVTI